MWEFSAEELRRLIQGKFEFRPCLECGGKGTVLVDNQFGITVTAIPKDRDPDWFSIECCDECIGLGGFLKLI